MTSMTRDTAAFLLISAAIGWAAIGGMIGLLLAKKGSKIWRWIRVNAWWQERLLRHPVGPCGCPCGCQGCTERLGVCLTGIHERWRRRS